MKVNRFGTSQRVFTEMVLGYVTHQIKVAAEMAVKERGYSMARAMLVEMRDVLDRTFLERDDRVKMLYDIIRAVEEKINREHSVPA